jgi:UPF0716 protein FxsA
MVIIAIALICGRLVRIDAREGIDMPALVVFAVLLGFPVLEAWVLFRLGDAIGFWVLVWLVAAAVAGVLLIRFEKLVWAVRFANQLRQQGSPLSALLASFRSLVAGLLLIFPGVISDVLALLLLIWPMSGGGSIRRGGGRDADRTPGVIEGDYRREDGVDRLPPDRN